MADYLVQKALDFIDELWPSHQVHALSSTPLVYKAREVLAILRNGMLTNPTLETATILHDVFGYSDVSEEDLETKFGPDVVHLLSTIRKRSTLHDGCRDIRLAIDNFYLKKACWNARAIKKAELISICTRAQGDKSLLQLLKSELDAVYDIGDLEHDKLGATAAILVRAFLDA